MAQQLLVNGLDGEGPRDIVGAFAGEAGIDPDAIGDIDIHDSVAVVEVDEQIADTVTEQMDENTVGTSTVSVKQIDNADRFDEIEDYVDTYTELVELEREAEMRQHEQEIKHLSGREREDQGRAILHLRGRDEDEGLGGHKIKFMRQRKGEQLPDTEIAVGDLVMLSKNDPLRDDNPTGTVVEKTNYSITVAFDPEPSGFVYGKRLRMDLYVNDITYQRMQDALQELLTADGALKELRDVIVGITEPDVSEEQDIDDGYNDALNRSQQEAVKRALDADTFHLIHGPPGTGKTTTVIEVIRQEIADGKSVLATAASNMAVDNMLEFLLEQGVDTVRVGHPARVTPQLREHTLDSRMQEKEDYKKAQELREQAFDLKDKQDDLTHPSGRWRRGMSNDRIKQLAEQGRGSRGVPAEKIAEMAEWLELQDEINELFDRVDALEDQAVEDVIKEADVVCTTNSTAGSELMDGKVFDVVVIDEATQATEPSCLIPITHGRKVVMAGDHKQLPPTVKHQEAAEQGLSDTLFERLAEQYSDMTDMLRVQYRMHEDIMQFSSAQWYDDKLRANEMVRHHTLDDLGFAPETDDTVLQKSLDSTEPVVFVDTQDVDADEMQREGSTSQENPWEAEHVADLVEHCIAGGVNPADIAVIAPYDDQVDRIGRLVDNDAVEVRTVDGFQGREKEVVIISLTRSNEQGVIGFLEDTRRLNVALTRAKRMLIVVGDADTVTAHDTYEAFVDYIAGHGHRARIRDD